MPSSRLQHEIEHGKKIASSAEEIWNWSSPAGMARADRRAGFLLKLGRFKAGEKLLEIGCGTGLFTGKIFSATHAAITAIDISPELLEQAKKIFPEVNFRIEDAMNLSFGSRTFDGVYGSSILHHLDFEPALKEIFRVLKPGGRMVFAEPNMLNPQIYIERHVNFVKKKLGVSPDETAIVRWKFAELLKKTGFAKVHIFPYDFLHPATPKALMGIVNGFGKILEKIPLIREIAGSVIIKAEKTT